MKRTRVKICGLTRAEDVLSAAQAGADALGFVFYGPSPRAVTVAQARALAAAVPAFVTRVGLFVDPDADTVRETLAQVPLDLLQFHGNESADFCAQFGRPYIKAIRVQPDTDLTELAAHYSDAQGLLLDSYVPGIPGGTGETFDWARVPRKLALPVILAGGLDADNVASAIAQVGPWAVDVSGGVEALDAAGKRIPGHKSAEAIEAFIRGVNRV